MANDDLLDFENVHEALRQARLEYGMLRLKMGKLLDLVRSYELWRGKSESFSRYLELVRIKDSAAYQYMRVARSMLSDDLSSDDLRCLAESNMRVLDQASKVISEANRADLFGMLSVLHERDALEAIKSMDSPESNQGQSAPAVQKLISNFCRLPDDQRIEFMQRMNVAPPSTRPPILPSPDDGYPQILQLSEDYPV